MRAAATEDEIRMQELYPNEDLHGLNENRICFSLNDLKFVLGFASNKKKRETFLSLCEQMLIKKGFKSLDFYDLQGIIRVVIGVKSISELDVLYKPIPFQKIEPNVEEELNFTFQNINVNENINEKVKSLEMRLNDLESRLDKL